MSTSNPVDSSAILIVGAGPMAIEYTKVLRDLGEIIVVVGRGNASAAAFTEQTGVTAHAGGVESWLDRQTGGLPSRAIVACGEKWIGSTARALMNAGVRSLLLEKPGGFDAPDIEGVQAVAMQTSAEVFVGYNRRFYAAVNVARDIIREDGGVTSFNFEFTEWSHVISDLVKEEGVKEQWFLSNSTHVIDLAFHLGGKPESWSAYVAGGVPWHKVASVFSGAGVTSSGALFSYQANWQAPGRWGLELLTKNHRLVFRPMEKLQIQKLGSVAINPVEIDDALDTRFKPGLHRQVRAFLGLEQICDLPTLQSQMDMLPVYLKMRGDVPIP